MFNTLLNFSYILSHSLEFEYPVHISKTVDSSSLFFISEMKVSISLFVRPVAFSISLLLIFVLGKNVIFLFLEPCAGNDPTSVDYKSTASPFMLTGLIFNNFFQYYAFPFCIFFPFPYLMIYMSVLVSDNLDKVISSCSTHYISLRDIPLSNFVFNS